MTDELTPVDIEKQLKAEAAPVKIYVLSGGSGSLGEQLIRTVMAQFMYTHVPIRVFPKILSKNHLLEILESAAKENALVIHTLVNPKHRDESLKFLLKRNMKSIDLVGPLIDMLTDTLGEEPIGRPGLYRDLHKSYFDRIDAINYTLYHDDGKNPDGWHEAEIILVGVSRVGKTPLSLYLSMLGWKVANIPLVPGIPPRSQLFEVDKRRVIGLKIDPTELVTHRKHRQRRLGVGANQQSSYVDLVKVYEETDEIRKFIRKSGFPMIDTTGKPIETIATEVTQLIQRKLKANAKLVKE